MRVDQVLCNGKGPNYAPLAFFRKGGSFGLVWIKGGAAVDERVYLLWFGWRSCIAKVVWTA